MEVQPVDPATEAVVRRFVALPMNIGEGFQIEQPFLFVPWRMRESELEQLFGEHPLRHVNLLNRSNRANNEDWPFSSFARWNGSPVGWPEHLSPAL